MKMVECDELNVYTSTQLHIMTSSQGNRVVFRRYLLTFPPCASTTHRHQASRKFLFFSMNCSNVTLPVTSLSVLACASGCCNLYCS